MRYVGIVGHEAAKFTPKGRADAEALIEELLADADSIMVSGACHLGGIDIWAREIAGRLGRTIVEFPPNQLDWEHGFKPRNLLIAKTCDEVHSIVVDKLPSTFAGRRFEFCYHCKTDGHVKSGGCWTAKQAGLLGKPATIHVIHQA